MSKYKYSLRLSYTNIEFCNSINKELEKLGYIQKKDKKGSAGQIAISNCDNTCPDGYYANYKYASVAQFDFNIGNKWEYEAALAIAAIRDDNKPYVGEWVVSNKDYYTLRERALWKISEVIQRNPISFHVEEYECDNKNGTSDLGYHPKATPEEIISYMKEKYKDYCLVKAYDEIVLPKRWCVRCPVKQDDLRIFLKKNRCGYLDAEDGYINYNPSGYSDWSGSSPLPEIAYNQWKQWYNQQQKEVETIKPTIMTKKLESFSIKGPINQYPDLLAWYNKNTSAGMNGESPDSYYNFNHDTNYGNCTSGARHTVITYKEWKEMIEGTTGKKIIGYKLIKEYPTKPVALGVMITSSWNEHNCAKFPEFWEVCYEEEKKEITLRIECDKPFNIIIKKGLFNMDLGLEGEVAIQRLKILKEKFDDIEKYKIRDWDFSVNTVNIGCKKNIPFKYLDEIIKTWDELNK